MTEQSGCPTTVNFLGIGVDALSFAEMCERIDRWLRDKEGRSHHIACINTYCVVSALENPELARIYNGADIAGSDSGPFTWWIRNISGLAADQLAGAEIIEHLAERAREKNYRFYLYGSTPEVVQGMKDALERDYPHIRIVGYQSPPFRSLTAEEDEAVCREINSLAPDIVLVGLGTPKQDYWIDEHLYKIRGAVLIASGAAFDFFSGRIKRAPQVVRRLGLEWLYRLLGKDFARLWRRYTVCNMRFLWNFLLQVTRLRVRQPVRWVRPEGGEGSIDAGRG